MGKTGYLSFHIDPADLAALDALAAAKGYGRSEFARKCLRAGLRLAPDFERKPTEHAVTAVPRRTPAGAAA